MNKPHIPPYTADTPDLGICRYSAACNNDATHVLNTRVGDVAICDSCREFYDTH